MENEIKHIHTFTNTVIPATCISKGYTLHRCECGYEHKDNFTLETNHTYSITEAVPPTCTVPGMRKYVCTVCGVQTTETLAPLGHRWGEWNTSTFATCTEKGSKFRICSQCGQVEEQVIEPTGHNLTNPKKSETVKGMYDYFCVSCGQTVTMPSAKTQKLRKLNTKKLVSALVAVVLAVAIILCMEPLIIPGYHYISAKMHISSENYEKAYYHLKKCDDFKSTKILLNDFYVAYEKEVRYYYDEDGELSSKYVDKYDERGNTLTSKSYYDDFNEPDYEYEYDHDYEYNSNGNLTKSTNYNSDGEISSITTYDYYDDGYSSHTIYYSDYEDDVKSAETKTEYDIFGHAIFTSEQNYNPAEDEEAYTETRYEYEYSRNGTIVSQIQYDTDGNKVLSIECDEHGNPVRMTYYNEEETETIKINYKYDKDGNPETATSKKDDTVAKMKFKYDKDGNLTEHAMYADGELSYKYEYEYDENGNRTKETYYNDDSSKPYRVTEYEDPFIVYAPKR